MWRICIYLLCFTIVGTFDYDILVQLVFSTKISVPNAWSFFCWLCVLVVCVLVLFFHIFVVRVHFCRNPHVIDFLLKCGAHWWKLKSANYFETEAVHLYPLTKEELRKNHLICIVPVRNVQRVKMHLQIFDYKLKYKLLENSPVELEI